MKKRIILLSLLILCFCTSRIRSQLLVGQAAPSLSGLKTTNNNLPDLTNMFVFVDFWASWCSPEVSSLEHINTLAQRFKDKVVFIAISDENESYIQNFLQDKQLNYIFFGLDENQTFKKKFAVEKIPIFFLISPDHKILASGLSNELMDYKLDSMVNKNDSIKLLKTAYLKLPIGSRK